MTKDGHQNSHPGARQTLVCDGLFPLGENDLSASLFTTERIGIIRKSGLGNALNFLLRDGRAPFSLEGPSRTDHEAHKIIVAKTLRGRLDGLRHINHYVIVN